jgi:uncharacterized protein with HEPN domain
MPSPSDRDSWLCVEDMLAFCERVLRYTGNVERDAFLADPMRYDATLRNLELIGEAANHVPDEVRAKAPSIPWRQVVATRNRLVHAYSESTPTRYGASFATMFPHCTRPLKRYWMSATVRTLQRVAEIQAAVKARRRGVRATGRDKCPDARR